jgi:hypothetical protein
MKGVVINNEHHNNRHSKVAGRISHNEGNRTFYSGLLNMDIDWAIR